jgi:Protein of unknown function (DUF3300)
MKQGSVLTHAVLWLLVVVMALPPWAFAQDAGGTAAARFSKEQLEQIVAPIALYPDELLSQILMASTYPLDVVQASRWASQNKNLKGDALTKALEKEDWDPSVKSLVNFPQVLQMMNEKLDWTQKLGDAFLAQEKDVMDTIQVLRKKAEAEGNLKTTKEQKVVVEKETIIIQPANPQVVYVPTYNPTVVYGAWPYPAYPPYYYYPPGYAAGAAAFGFATGVAVGAAWGYAWGHANWHGGNVDVDINRNTNINNNINRNNYQQQMQQRGQSAQGKWQHNSSQRKGVAYRDSATAQKFGQSSARTTQASQGARGYGESRGAGAQTRDVGAARGGAGGRESAFSGAGSGSFDRSASQRGQASRGQSYGGGGGTSGGGSRGGGGYSGGGGSRGGGGFSGGGGSRGGGGGGRR